MVYYTKNQHCMVRVMYLHQVKLDCENSHFIEGYVQSLELGSMHDVEGHIVKVIAMIR